MDTENKLVVTKEDREEGRGRLWVWEQETQTTMHETYEQQ